MKGLYINGMGCISPQHSENGATFLGNIKIYEHNRLSCVEPDYSPYLDPKTLRRMGRLLKYGTTAGLMALQDAAARDIAGLRIDQYLVPDSIATGTGLGQLEDSGKFLKSVYDAQNGVVSPTAFMQSTHNTISSNIALMVGCRGPNNTFVHKGFSLESAIIDAQMLCAQGIGNNNILVGTYDETTDYSYDVMQKLRLIRQAPTTNTRLYEYHEPGTISGEGAAFFLLSAASSSYSYAIINGVATHYQICSTAQSVDKIKKFLGSQYLAIEDIDVLVSGVCGDQRRDAALLELHDGYFAGQTIVGYKHLCGEYMTSASFALWLAAMMANTGTIPVHSILNNRDRKPRNILLYNIYKKNHSLILVSAIEPIAAKNSS